MQALIATFHVYFSSDWHGICGDQGENKVLDGTSVMIYTWEMSNVRAKGQKLIPTQMSEVFVRAIDRVSREAGFDDRSKFIREAVKEKILALGYKLPPGSSMAPNRRKQIYCAGERKSGRRTRDT